MDEAAGWPSGGREAFALLIRGLCAFFHPPSGPQDNYHRLGGPPTKAAYLQSGSRVQLTVTTADTSLSVAIGNSLQFILQKAVFLSGHDFAVPLNPLRRNELMTLWLNGKFSTTRKFHNSCAAFW